MKRFFSGLTDIGLLRSVNQDAYYVDPHGRFFIVADGMGGHAGGQEASQIATQVIHDYVVQHWEAADSSEVLLRNALLQANAAILQDQRQHPERGDMGTTVVVVIFRDEADPWCAHVGDSRLYRLRGDQLEQITADHTWVARALQTGDLTADEARVHPWRHVLAQCLGRADLAGIEVQPLPVQSGDRLLLCSDGLTEEVADSIIAQQLQQISTCDQAAMALVNAAKTHGGRDNITVVIVAIDPLTSA